MNTNKHTHFRICNSGELCLILFELFPEQNSVLLHVNNIDTFSLFRHISWRLPFVATYVLISVPSNMDLTTKIIKSTVANFLESKYVILLQIASYLHIMSNKAQKWRNTEMYLTIWKSLHTQGVEFLKQAWFCWKKVWNPWEFCKKRGWVEGFIHKKLEATRL